jgi:hypothetical protein
VPSALLLVAGAALAVSAVRRDAGRAFALLAAMVVLVPADLVVPNGLTPLPTFVRVAVVAVAAGLLARGHRDAFALTPVHLAAGAYAVVALTTGVVLAPDEVRLRDAVYDGISLLEPLAVFVVALAALRVAGDDRLPVRVLARLTAAMVVLATVEHATGGSFARLVGSGEGLETRAGETRVRVGQEFALALAWALAALAPAALVVARRRGVLAEAAALGGCLAAAYWTFSRSAPVAFAIGLTALVLTSRDRRLGLGVLVAGAGLVVTALALPSVGDRFTEEVDAGAIAVRGERLPVVLEAAAQRPVPGIGLSGTTGLGLPATDNSLLLAYAETGVAAVVLLLVALGCGLVCAGRGLRAPPGPARDACAAAVAGALVLVVAGLAFDALQVRGTADLLWLLLAVGVAASERAVGRQPLLVPWRDVPRVRLAVVAGALVVGTGAALLWPQHTALHVRFETLPTSRLVGAFDPVAEGRRLVGTVCGVAGAYDLRDDGVRLDCRDVNGPAGVGELRAQAPTRDRAAAALGELAGIVTARTAVTDLRLSPLDDGRTGRPTAARTAALWLSLAALALVALVPSGPLRRLEQRLQAGARGRPGGMGGADLHPGAGRPLGTGGRVAQRRDQRLDER